MVASFQILFPTTLKERDNQIMITKIKFVSLRWFFRSTSAHFQFCQIRTDMIGRPVWKHIWFRPLFPKSFSLIELCKTNVSTRICFDQLGQKELTVLNTEIKRYFTYVEKLSVKMDKYLFFSYDNLKGRFWLRTNGCWTLGYLQTIRGF